MTRARDFSELATVYDGGASIGFRNRIINGSMAVNQRGSSSYTSNGYTLDRWKVFNSGGTYTLSQQTYSQGSQPAFGLTNFMRVTRGSPSAILYLSQLIENVALFDNIVVTVSFYARASGAVSVPLRVMQEFGSGGSSGVNCGSVSHSLTTTVQRFSGTYTLPSLAGKTIGTGSHLEVTFDIPATTETIEISGVQVEVGSVASPFECRDIGTELRLCQRYCWVKNASSGNTTNWNLGWFNGKARTSIATPVPMRSTITTTFTGSTGGAFFTTNDDNLYRNFNYDGTFSEASGVYPTLIMSFTDAGGNAAAAGYGPAYIQNGRSVIFSAEL